MYTLRRYPLTQHPNVITYTRNHEIRIVKELQTQLVKRWSTLTVEYWCIIAAKTNSNLFTLNINEAFWMRLSAIPIEYILWLCSTLFICSRITSYTGKLWNKKSSLKSNYIIHIVCSSVNIGIAAKGTLEGTCFQYWKVGNRKIGKWVTGKSERGKHINFRNSN